MTSPRIALIHATALAVNPVVSAFQSLWPDTTLMNLLDDSLSVDLANNQGVLNNAMITRFITLAQYAKKTGADAILFTCSAFGPAIEAAKGAVKIPTLKPNEAMFEQALALNTDVNLVATFLPSLAPMQEEYSQMAAERQMKASLNPLFVPEAMAALGRGDARSHHQLIAEQAQANAKSPVILLAQFSMAAAKDTVARLTGKQVLTSPECAVLQLQQLFKSQ